MKKAVFLLLLMVSIPVFSQSGPRDSLKIADISGSDSIWWTRIEGRTPVIVTWEFTDLDANDATLSVYYGDYDETESDTIPISVDRSTASRYPITLDKTDSEFYSTKDGETSNVYGVEKDNWLHDFIGVGLSKGSVTSGAVIQRIKR